MTCSVASTSTNPAGTRAGMSFSTNSSCIFLNSHGNADFACQQRQQKTAISNYLCILIKPKETNLTRTISKDAILIPQIRPDASPAAVFREPSCPVTSAQAKGRPQLNLPAAQVI